MSAFACSRGRAKGPFGSADLKVLKALFPHLQKAMQLHQHLAALRGQQRASMDILDRLAIGFVLLDDNGNIVMMNRAAEMIVAADDGITVHRGRFAASSRQESIALSVLISAAALARRELSPLQPIAIPRPSGKRPFVVSCMPASIDAFPGCGQFASVVALIRDPEDKTPLMEVYLAKSYGLTPAECRLAERLIQDDTLRDAAERLGIKYSTARTHAKRLFEKTDTHHRGELVRLLLRSAERVAMRDQS